MRRILTPIFGACLILGGVTSSAGQDVPGGNEKCSPLPAGAFRSLSSAEMDILLRDAAASNPSTVEAMRQDPAARRAQLDSIRDLLAFSSQATKEGLAEDPLNCRELEYIRAETISTAYEKEINKGRAAITPARISAYWSVGKPGTVAAEREAAFQRFLATKLALMKALNPSIPDRPMTEAETEQVRQFFATQQINFAEYEKGSAAIPKAIRDGIGVRVKLQQAQFLARLYAAVAASKISVTETDVNAFIAGRPELDATAKRAKAEKILQRAKSGEDFAKLANEFTQDPGNKDPNGVLQGGLYRDVRRGMMVEPFEKAALEVDAGQVNPAVVESDFGYHIVKLERKDPSPDGTYDVRHILISTTVPDPNNPGGRELPVKQYARTMVGTEKEKRMIAEIVAANSISVPSDFSLPPAATKVVAKAPARKAPVRRTRKRK